MGIRQIRPVNASSRFQSFPDFAELTVARPQKSLSRGKSATGGRNNRGNITSWFRGRGHKRKYREIDFRRDKHGIPAKVVTIEYDPNRSARIALLNYADGEKRYILAPEGLRVGMDLLSGEGAEINVGNALPLRLIPLGTMVHNVELKRGKGGQMVRSAGAAAQLMAKEGAFAQIKLPSGEVRKVDLECYATVGQVGNLEHENTTFGKAGRKRWLGRKPHNRGVSMNPVDHPMGGGEGKTSGGRHPCTPWGVPTKGFKTRNNKRTDAMIVRRRNRK